MQRQSTDGHSSESNNNQPQFILMLGDNLSPAPSVDEPINFTIIIMFLYNIISELLEKSNEYSAEQKALILAGAKIYCETVADARSAREVQETVSDPRPFYWPTRPQESELYRSVEQEIMTGSTVQRLPEENDPLRERTIRQKYVQLLEQYTRACEEQQAVVLAAAHSPLVPTPSYIRNIGLFHRAIMPPQAETAEAEVCRFTSPRPSSPMEEVD